MSPYILVIRRIDCILLFFFSEGGICSLPSDNWAGLTPSVSQNFWKIKGSFTATAKPTNLLKTIRSEPLFRGHYSCQTFRRCYYCFLFFLSFFFLHHRFVLQLRVNTAVQPCWSQWESLKPKLKLPRKWSKAPLSGCNVSIQVGCGGSKACFYYLQATLQNTCFVCTFINAKLKHFAVRCIDVKSAKPVELLPSVFLFVIPSF